ncbi:hypothetical protein [Reyranella sp.]|uniref:hypothetical protein n=1 Tax=Reyranella sp. TaxID=1929291 RepID=UPI00122412CB|nr:hypothetical protein [Reyranella sp.]TAJ84314.1 MAG: hypothetical protein EPO50_19795 [Reyranella sp.]
MRQQSLRIVLRLLAAIGGGYAVAAGLAALTAVILFVTGGLPRSEAVILASMLAFIFYLALLLWAFAERSLLRLCSMLVAAGVVSWGAAIGLMRLVGGS